MCKKEYFISIVIPLNNNAPILEGFLKTIESIIEPTYANYEIILVNNASSDNTKELILSILKKHKCIRYFELTRPHSIEVAISAGFEEAIGDVILSLSPETDNPELLINFIQKIRETNGLVSGIDQKSKNYKISKTLFYWYAQKALQTNLLKNMTYLHGMNRTALNSFLKLNEDNRYFKLFNLYTGLPIEEFHYEPNKEKNKDSFSQNARLGARMIISNSLHPLRFITILGIIASLLNLGYIIYIVLIYLKNPAVAEGWTTTSLQISGLFIFMFLMLTVISEYLGRVLKFIQSTPRYYTTEEKNSSVLIADIARRNVMNETD